MTSAFAQSVAVERWNPFDEEFRRNPYPTYHYYRSNDPVHYGMPPDGVSPGCWFLTKYEDAARVLADQRFGLEFHKVIPPEHLPPVPDEFSAYFAMIQKWLLFRDPPDHTRLKSLVRSAFTPSTIATLAPIVTLCTKQLLQSKLESGSMDLIADLAFPLPVMVISKLLGFPYENQADLKRWSHDLLAAIDLRGSREESDACFAKAAQSVTEFSSYVRDHIAARRRQPGPDLLSTLISVEQSSSKLTEEELIATCIMLLWAGHETTVNLIGNGMLALLSNRDQYRDLKDNPFITEGAVEELLRFDSPAQMTFRFAFADVDLGGKRLHTGDSVAVVLGAANRDPDVFENPDDLNLRRPPMRHLAFGSGTHYCLGAFLARQEGAIAIRSLLDGTKDMSLVDGEPTWNRSIGLRGVTSLRIAIATR